MESQGYYMLYVKYDNDTEKIRELKSSGIERVALYRVAWEGDIWVKPEGSVEVSHEAVSCRAEQIVCLWLPNLRTAGQ